VAGNNRITLYDLQLASGCTISPFVWATKYALAHKGFDVDVVPGAVSPASWNALAVAPSASR
jgi:hypothetical protein